MSAGTNLYINGTTAASNLPQHKQEDLVIFHPKHLAEVALRGIAVRRHKQLSLLTQMSVHLRS